MSKNEQTVKLVVMMDTNEQEVKRAKLPPNEDLMSFEIDELGITVFNHFAEKGVTIEGAEAILYRWLGLLRNVTKQQKLAKTPYHVDFKITHKKNDLVGQVAEEIGQRLNSPTP